MIRRRAHPLWLAYLWLFFGFILAPIAIVTIVAFQAPGFVAFPIEGFSFKEPLNNVAILAHLDH